MEQTLLEPSIYRITSVSIDSRFADQYYHGTADFMIRLPSTMRNVMRIAVSSIEVPEVAYVFSAKAGNTTYTVEGIGSFSVADGNYTPAQLAAAVSGSAGAIGLDCSYNPITNRFAFVATSGGPYTVALYGAGSGGGVCDGPCPLPPVDGSARYWGIGYNMGFRTKTIVVSVGKPVIACQSPQTAAPAYTLLQVQCPEMVDNTLHRTENGSFVPALAKLVLRNGAYALQTDDAGNLLRKENVFQSPSSISQLRISLLDAYGRFVELGDTDWSMTFEVMEVVNSCQYTALTKAYGRC
jgi:hypothetical protein